MPNVLETRRRAAADDLAGIVTEMENYLARDDADAESADYVALREQRDTAQTTLADLLATIEARRMAQHTPVTPTGETLSPIRQVLREYDRGISRRFDIEYDLDAHILRELQTGDPYFTPSPTRIQVETLPVITPSLDIVSKVPSGQHYDFVVPPPPEMAVTVAEGARKHTVDWVSTRVEGTLETDAHLIDVSRQTLEDDASAERILRTWLTDGVRLKQDAKVQAAISGATDTLTASGVDIRAALRNGKSKLSALGIIATAAYLNPDDAAALDLTSDDITGYDIAWRMRIVESPAIAVGAPIVGAMSRAVYLVYRRAISTYLTDSGMTEETTPRDRFSHNLIGILGEGRSRAHVVQPKLLVKCTVTP